MENDVKNQTDTKKRNIRLRIIIVILFLIIFALISYIQLRGEYLEYLELGKQYTNIFKTNQIYRYGFMIGNFIFLYCIIYFTNRGIKKSLKVFFEKEKKEMPKLLNKSLALVISAIVSFVIASSFARKNNVNTKWSIFWDIRPNIWTRYCILCVPKATNRSSFNVYNSPFNKFITI